MEGKERLKKKVDHSSLVGGRFNRQGHLYKRLAMCGHKASKSLHLPTRILKVYIEAFTGFTMNSVLMVSTTHYYLNAVSLQQLPVLGRLAELTFQELGRAWEGTSLQANLWSSPLQDLLQQLSRS